MRRMIIPPHSWNHLTFALPNANWRLLPPIHGQNSTLLAPYDAKHPSSSYSPTSHNSPSHSHSPTTPLSPIPMGWNFHHTAPWPEPTMSMLDLTRQPGPAVAYHPTCRFGPHSEGSPRIWSQLTLFPACSCTMGHLLANPL